MYGGAIFMSTPGPLHPLGTMIQQVLNETGRILEREGCLRGLGEWVLGTTHAIPAGPHVASNLIEQLMNTFPGFADKAIYEGKQVLILKKAQLLVADLYRHLKNKEPRFNFEDIQHVTVFADNVLPAVLRKVGILELSEELRSKVDAKEELPKGNAEVELRCVAIAACDAIVASWNERRAKEPALEPVELDTMKLDLYLWNKGKEEGFRTVERHATKGTIYY